MFGEHAAFIIPAYLISFVALALTTLVTILNYHQRKRELAQLEESQKDGDV